MTLVSIFAGGSLLAEGISERIPDNAVRYWLEILFFLIGGAYLSIKFIKEFRSDPPPDKKYATKDEVLRVDGDLLRVDGEARTRAAANAERMTKIETDFRNQMVELRQYLHQAVHDQGQAIGVVSNDIKDGIESQREAIESVNKSSEARISKVHGRLDGIAQDVGGLKVSTQMITATQQEAQRTLNVLLSRTAPSSRRGGANDL